MRLTSALWTQNRSATTATVRPAPSVSLLRWRCARETTSTSFVSGFRFGDEPESISSRVSTPRRLMVIGVEIKAIAQRCTSSWVFPNSPEDRCLVQSEIVRQNTAAVGGFAPPFQSVERHSQLPESCRSARPVRGTAKGWKADWRVSRGYAAKATFHRANELRRAPALPVVSSSEIRPRRRRPAAPGQSCADASALKIFFWTLPTAFIGNPVTSSSLSGNFCRARPSVSR